MKLWSRKKRDRRPDVSSSKEQAVNCFGRKKKKKMEDNYWFKFTKKEEEKKIQETWSLIKWRIGVRSFVDKGKDILTGKKNVIRREWITVELHMKSGDKLKISIKWNSDEK
uniref:Uncharacterized protein n=1 Tax=Caenorhabditis tropicalis TaxID=1561998 RepID=A0A1I7UH80_9PELO